MLLSNSDIAFDESLGRLGDPSTLDMAHKVGMKINHKDGNGGYPQFRMRHGNTFILPSCVSEKLAVSISYS